jgi:MFS family permease
MIASPSSPGNSNIPPVLWSTPAKLLFFLLVYLGQHTPVGFTWLALPVILRSYGISLGTIGMVALLYSPWALKFLYAPWVDRFIRLFPGRKKGWIVTTRLLALANLPALAQCAPEEHLGPVFGFVLAMNLSFALGDLAVDGYGADILLPAERAWGSAVQMAGNFTGFMIGGGIFMILFHHLGWQATLWIMAALITVLSLPLIFLLKHPDRLEALLGIQDPATPPAPSGGMAFIRQRQTIGFFGLLLVMAMVLKTGYQLRFTLLGDLGLAPDRIGFLLLWAGSPVAIFGTWLGSHLIRRLPAAAIFTRGCMVAASLGGLSWILAAGLCRASWYIALVMGVEQLLVGTLMAVIYSLILQTSAGPQSTTDYGILCGVQHFTTFGAVILGGWLGQALGYQTFFFGLALASLAAVIPVRLLFSSRLKNLDRALSTPYPQTNPIRRTP